MPTPPRRTGRAYLRPARDDASEPTGREYLRVSRDPSGKQRSVKEQHEDNERIAARRGVALATPYAERAAISASRYSGKTRGAFAELLADLKAGEFGADELWLWESSRGSRKVGEWVALIEACEAAGVRIHVTSHDRTYDPTNARDRRTLQEDAVDSEWETAKMSARIKRAAAARAEAGRPHSRPLYGYVRRYSEQTRAFLSEDPHPVEAPIVRDMFDRIDHGKSINSIVVDFRDRGVLTRSGKPWAHGYVRHVLRNRAYVGIRTHHGAEYPAIWPALVDADQFWRVQRILDGRKRTSDRPGREALYLASRIGRCNECEGWIGPSLRSGRPYYQCPAGHVRLPQDALDEYLGEVVVGHLSSPDVFQHRAEDDGALEQIRAEINRKADELDEVDATDPDDVHHAKMLGTLRRRLVDELAELRDQAQRLAVPAELAEWVGTEDEVRASWRAATVAARRSLLRALLTPAAVGELRILRVGKGQRVPIRQRVRFGPPEGAEPGPVSA